MRFIKLLKILFFGGILLTGCLLNGCSNDPLGSLKSDTDNNCKDYKFWHQQYKANTTLWHQAIQYCLPNGDKPNCQCVMNLAAFGDGHQKAPKIGQSGHYIHIDT